jgi:hypothetical protein
MVATAAQQAIYDQVVAITKDHLGPAAERFVARQIKTHLNKKPEDLNAQDIPDLAEWTVLAIGLLTEDKTMVDSYQNELLKLNK